MFSTGSATRAQRFVLGPGRLVLLILGARGSDIFSDITGSPADEGRALDLKAESFWGSVLHSANSLQEQEAAHLTLYADAAAALAELPPANAYVREALKDALTHLRSADAAVGAQGTDSAELATEKLAAPTGGGPAFSFLRGTNLFAQVLRRFVGEGTYAERLHEDVGDRQANVLPSLRSTAAITGGVLSDCRLASKRSFDALKYDIYEAGAPKTPEAAKRIAHRIVDAAAETRKRFTSFITESASSIARDTATKDEPAGVTVTRNAVARSVDTFTASFTVRGFSNSEQLINL